ncbi:MAG TPA: MlaD family protein [Tepidisphaeraceae bacterium]|nr:MlaD family protein [Tepidisphaeraceae bacterium]
MPKERNAFRAGLFIVISLVLIIAIIVSIQGLGRMIEPRQTRLAIFELTDDLGGLRVGDDVRAGGYKVGAVRDIELIDPGEDAEPHLRVTFTLPQRLAVREDAIVAIQGTITGTAWLNFETFGKGAPLPQGMALAGHPGAMADLLNAARGIAPEVKGALVDVRTVTLPKVNNAVDRTAETVVTFKTTGERATALADHLRSKIDPVVERIYGVTEPAKDMMVHLRDMFGDTKGDYRTSMANVASATGTLKEKLPPLLDKADAVMAQLSTAVEGANGALIDVKTTMANAKDISESVQGLLVGNRGKLDGMIASMKATGDNLEAASVEIRHSPWRLLYKPKKGEVENLNLYDSARQFAAGANDLNDAAASLRDALKDPTLKESEVRKLIERLDQTFLGFKEVEEQLWKKVRD